jgi:hypothetical protein
MESAFLRPSTTCIVSIAQIRAVIKHRVSSSTSPIPIQHILQPFLAKPNNSSEVYNPQVKMNAAFRIRVYIFFLRRYNFREVLAFSTSFFHLVRFLIQPFQFVLFILVISLFTSSSHLFLGLPSDLVSAGDHSYTFFYHAVTWQTRYVSEPS